jgi:activator of 2-hydroxyglutaryl-CoA dehydratase
MLRGVKSLLEMSPNLVTKEDSIMDLKQNQKINQVTEKTLVIGIDIAKQTHYACFVDDRGWVLQKSFSVSQSKDGFELFYKRVLEAIKENDLDLTRLLPAFFLFLLFLDGADVTF